MKKVLFILTLVSLTSLFNCKAQEKNQIQPAKEITWHEKAQRRDREIFKKLDIDRLFSFRYEFDSTGKKLTSVSVDYYDPDKYKIKTETYSNQFQIQDPESIFKKVEEFKLDSLKDWKEFTTYFFEKGKKPDTIRHLYEYGQNSLMTKLDNECFSYTFNDKGLVSEEITRVNDKVTALCTNEYDDKNRVIKWNNYEYVNGEKKIKMDKTNIYDDANRKLDEIGTVYGNVTLKYRSSYQFDSEDRLVESTDFNDWDKSTMKFVSKYDENGLLSESQGYMNNSLHTLNYYKYVKAGEDFTFDFYGVKIK